MAIEPMKFVHNFGKTGDLDVELEFESARFSFLPHDFSKLLHSLFTSRVFDRCIAEALKLSSIEFVLELKRIFVCFVVFYPKKVEVFPPTKDIRMGIQ